MNWEPVKAVVEPEIFHAVPVTFRCMYPDCFLAFVDRCEDCRKDFCESHKPEQSLLCHTCQKPQKAVPKGKKGKEKGTFNPRSKKS